MNIFISSVVSGYEEARDAAARAIEALGHTVIRAENFPASPDTAQQECLAAARESDVLVLLLGARYGEPQSAGLSPTHEEYRETRDRKPILVFIEEDTTAEARQQEFINEVQAWSAGQLTASFSTPEELNVRVVRALHEYALAASTGDANEAEMLDRALAMFPAHRSIATSPQILVSISGGPHQQVLGPTQLEREQFTRELQREAQLGDRSVLDPSAATTINIDGTRLVLQQDTGFVSIDQAGSVCIGQPAQRASESSRLALPSLIEEEVTAIVAKALLFGTWFLDEVDPVHRITSVVPLVRLGGTGYMPWRTRAQHDASPHSATVGMGDDNITVHLTPTARPRRSLSQDVDRIVEDLVTLLRRERI